MKLKVFKQKQGRVKPPFNTKNKMTKEKKVVIILQATTAIKEKAREQSKKLFGSENISQYICFLINNDPPR